LQGHGFTHLLAHAHAQASRKLKETSLLDMLTSTPKERRMKQYRTPNQK
jgi:hypothetical protein